MESLSIGRYLTMGYAHVGVVVEDREKGVEFLTSLWGLGPWDIVDYEPQESDIKVGEPFKLKLAWVKFGPGLLELIQPVKGKTIWSNALENKGEGLHHLSLKVSSWDEMVTDLQVKGGNMEAGAIYQGRRWAYFTGSPGGIVIEYEEEVPTDPSTWQIWG